MMSVEDLNRLGAGRFPAHVGLVFTHAAADEIRAEVSIRAELMAPNGYLHAGVVVTLADTCCGYGCRFHLPQGASGFTTVELKSNHLATALEGAIECVARPLHTGRTTQVWDAVVSSRQSGRTIALFRCTQMILYPKPAK